MPSAFDNQAAKMVSDLVRVLGLTPEQASGPVGNGGAESGLLAINERRPAVPGSRGGYGFFQWTGPRRVAFENWCRAKGLDPTSYEANFGFLVHELQTTHKEALRYLRMTKTAKAAAETFAWHFEKFAGYQNLNSANYRHRIQLAERALALYRANRPTPAPQPSPPPAPAPAPVEPPMPIPAPVQTDPVLPPKPWYQSRQIIGAFVAIGMPIAARYLPFLAGMQVDAATDKVVSAIDIISQIVGGYMIIQGRLTSTRPIAGTQAAVDVMEARTARQEALLQAHATVPPGYAPVQEAWASEQPAQPSGMDLMSLPLAVIVDQLPSIIQVLRQVNHATALTVEHQGEPGRVMESNP